MASGRLDPPADLLGEDLPAQRVRAGDRGEEADLPPGVAAGDRLELRLLGYEDDAVLEEPDDEVRDRVRRDREERAIPRDPEKVGRHRDQLEPVVERGFAYPGHCSLAPARGSQSWRTFPSVASSWSCISVNGSQSWVATCVSCNASRMRPGISGSAKVSASASVRSGETPIFALMLSLSSTMNFPPTKV